MRKIKNHTLLLMGLILIMVLSTTYAWAVTPKVYDQAQLFTSEELDALEKSANELGEKLQLDIVIVTTDENDGKSSRDYADDFYDQNGFGYGTEADGLLLLINMEDREVYISTCGKAIRYFTDARIQSVLDQIYTSLADGKYHDAVVTFLNQVEYYVGQGIPQNQNTQYENNGTYPTQEGTTGYNRPAQAATELSTGQKIFFALLASVAIGGVSVLIMAMGNRGVKTTNSRTYLKNQELNIYSRQDDLINTQVTHVTIQSNNGNSSGGGSSTVHRSSGGQTHGGGGRKF